MTKRRFIISFYSVYLLHCLLFAQDTIVPRIEWTGMASLVEGQFVKCNYFQDGVMPFRPWLTNEYARLGIKAIINRRISLAIIPQVKLWNDTWNWNRMNASSAGNNPFSQHATITLFDAEGTVSFGNDAVACAVSAGVIPYKYNPDAKNLGEYLFRCGEHPAYIQTSFDQAYATLTGFRVNAEIVNKLSLDLFLTCETQVQPMNDWSLSFLAGYSIPRQLDIGVGIMYDRVIPIAGLLDKNDGGSGAPNTYKTRTGVIDSFSWGGTKVMARLSIDPKGFLPPAVSNIFGKEDGKIYGEAALLGVNSFTAYKDSIDPNNGLPVPGKYVVDSSNNYYSDIWQRIPIMFGFNIPTFKILDYLSTEWEWYGWPFAPSLYNLENFNYILPKPTGIDYKGSHWKYSFNMKKTVWGHISIIGQIARDHTRHDVFYNGNTDVNEVFQTPDEWGWWLKLQYHF